MSEYTSLYDPSLGVAHCSACNTDYSALLGHACTGERCSHYSPSLLTPDYTCLLCKGISMNTPRTLKDIASSLIYEGLTTGKITLNNGEERTLETSQILALAKYTLGKEEVSDPSTTQEVSSPEEMLPMSSIYRKTSPFLFKPSNLEGESPAKSPSTSPNSAGVWPITLEDS